jgi:hypothetical protein
MVVEDIYTMPKRAQERQRSNRVSMRTVVKAVRTQGGKVVPIVPGGMVDVALRDLDARLTESERDV